MSLIWWPWFGIGGAAPPIPAPGVMGGQAVRGRRIRRIEEPDLTEEEMLIALILSEE